ncbi:29956_t:CDS:1, partial [Racocetra persica]
AMKLNTKQKVLVLPIAAANLKYQTKDPLFSIAAMESKYQK